MTISPARLAAFRILLKVETEDHHADDLLHGPALRNLEPRDRALATTLVLGTLRWQLALDAAIAPLLRAGTLLAPEVAIALRIGLFQLRYLDRIPAHAALSESVELAKESGFAGMAGLVNAILRKLQRQSSPDFSRAAVLAHPAWMVDRWRARYGEDTAQRICEADQEIPKVAVRRTELQTANEFSPGMLLTRAAIVPQDGPQHAAGNRTQDEGSQLVAEIAAAVAAASTRVLDACAAPGGKTAILAERLPAANIIAADISPARLKLMQRLVPPRYREQMQFVQADATELPEADPFAIPFDLILCDVPCSGTGTLARNPEIRLRLSPPMLRQFAQKQLQIVSSAWARLRSGGTLVYSTCSLEPEEDSQVIGQFRRSCPDAIIIPPNEMLRALESRDALTASGASLLRETAVDSDFLRTLPGIHPCDGFFIAALRKP